jgi:putative DNA methylase
MNAASSPATNLMPPRTCAAEIDFPVVEVSRVAEQESWRKEVNRPLYHIHKWWATRLGTVFRAITLGALLPRSQSIWDEFYRTHNLAGKVVLDPFMGSGTTLGEALKLGCSVVGCDVNPISSFLVKQGLTRVDETALRRAFDKLEEEAAPEIRRLYETTHPESGRTLQVLYYFWVKVVETPAGESIPLLDRYVFAQDAYPKKKPLAQLLCRHCGAVFQDRFDATETTCPSCNSKFDPQAGPAKGQYVTGSDGTRHKIKDLLPAEGPPKHRLYALMAIDTDGRKVYLRASAADVALYEDAERRLREEVLPLPTMTVRPGHNTDQARGYHYNRWRDFFNARQLLSLGLLLRAIMRIPERSVQEQLLCLFSSTLEFNNLFCSFKGEGTGAVRHMFSNHILKPERTPLENSVWGGPRTSGTFASLFESRLIRAKQYLDAPFELSVGKDLFESKGPVRKVIASRPLRPAIVDCWDSIADQSGSALLLNGDSASLPIPDESIDAVITDPPYFDFVHYSELSDFFFAWLAPVLSDRYPWFTKRDSSDPGEVQQKDPQTFAIQLGRVLLEAARVLRPEGVLAFTFHHSRPEGWAAIAEALTAAGLRVVNAHPVHAEMRGASPKNAATAPISLDAILICKKKGEHDIAPSNMDRDLVEAREKVLVLSRSGLRLSSADIFVIAASCALEHVTGMSLRFAEALNHFEEIQRTCERTALEGWTLQSPVTSNRHTPAGAVICE